MYICVYTYKHVQTHTHTHTCSLECKHIRHDWKLSNIHTILSGPQLGVQWQTVRQARRAANSTACRYIWFILSLRLQVCNSMLNTFCYIIHNVCYMYPHTLMCYICLSIDQSTMISIYLSIYLLICLNMCQKEHATTWNSTCETKCINVRFSMYRSIYYDTYPSIYLSTHLSIYLSVYSSVYPSQSICMSILVLMRICVNAYMCICVYVYMYV